MVVDDSGVLDSDTFFIGGLEGNCEERVGVLISGVFMWI